MRPAAAPDVDRRGHIFDQRGNDGTSLIVRTVLAYCAAIAAFVAAAAGSLMIRRQHRPPLASPASQQPGRPRAVTGHRHCPLADTSASLAA